MVLNLSHKAVVTDINLLVCWLHLLSLSLLILQVHEGVKYDSKDKVHDEEVAYNHYRQAVNDRKNLVIHIHHVVHHGTPAIGRDKLIDHDQGTADVVEGCNVIKDLDIVLHIIIINA